jgi:hypothetical protein
VTNVSVKRMASSEHARFMITSRETIW